MTQAPTQGTRDRYASAASFAADCLEVPAPRLDRPLMQCTRADRLEPGLLFALEPAPKKDERNEVEGQK